MARHYFEPRIYLSPCVLRAASYVAAETPAGKVVPIRVASHRAAEHVRILPGLPPARGEYSDDARPDSAIFAAR